MTVFYPYPKIVGPEAKLVIDARISTPLGWLLLNADPYQLAPPTGETVSVVQERKTVASPFLEGKFTVNARRDEVIETVTVRIKAASTGLVRAALAELTDALDQTGFTFALRVEDYEQLWVCSAADYTVSIPRELLHARMAQITAQIPRQPAFTAAEVI